MSYQEQPYDIEALVAPSTDKPSQLAQPYGRTGYTPVKPRQHKPRKTPAPAQEMFKRPIYLCPELGRTSNRPNAYDAYELPSIYAGVRKPYRFAK